MAGDQVREVERERTQLVTDLLVELLRLDVGSELRHVLALTCRRLVIAAARLVLAAVAGTGAALAPEASGTVP
nr:hypothetical protein GCM10020093_030200 [Planobispora longispora]